jgi:hypothetical protein
MTLPFSQDFQRGYHPAELEFAMSAPRPDDPPPFDDGEYAVLQVPDAWHVLSLAFFVASLGARFLVAFLPSGRGIFTGRSSPPSPSRSWR